MSDFEFDETDSAEEGFYASCLRRRHETTHAVVTARQLRRREAAKCWKESRSRTGSSRHFAE